MGSVKIHSIIGSYIDILELIRNHKNRKEKKQKESIRIVKIGIEKNR